MCEGAVICLPIGAPAGSGRSFTAYVFNKAHLPAQLAPLAAAELAAAEGLPTPALSHDSPRLALSAAPSVDQQQQGEEEGEEHLKEAAAAAVMATAVAAALGASEEPQKQQQQQQPVLGRGARRATRSRKAAEAAAVEAGGAGAATQQQPQCRRATRAGAKATGQDKAVQQQEQQAAAAEAAEAALPAAAAGRRVNGSPTKLRGVQKRQSPRKQHPSVLLPGAGEGQGLQGGADAQLQLATPRQLTGAKSLFHI